MEKFIFTADLHGNGNQYNKLFEYAMKENPNVVIIGGDITPKNLVLRTPKLQREFLTNTLFSLIKSFKERSNAEVLIIMGNDDFKSNYQLMLDAQCIIGFRMIDHRPYISANGYYYVGYSYVPYTPFKFKDWERRDLNRQKDASERNDVRIEGVISVDDELVHYNVNDTMMNYSIENDLNRITQNISRDKLILVSHAPPYDTACDYTCTNKTDCFDHVGSKAVKKFIEREQPLITLHGHIHDTVGLTNKFPEIIGETLCAAVGNDHISETPYVIVGEINTDCVLKRILL